jgi:hypothetical protein
VALREQSHSTEPPLRPAWRAGLIAAQFGPMCEDLLAVALTAAASGSGTVGRLVAPEIPVTFWIGAAGVRLDKPGVLI